MAHGTGDYLVRIHKADIETDEYLVAFTRTRHYYYDQMSDSYEPTYYDTEEYEATIMKWHRDRWGWLVADCLSDGYRTGVITKDEANKIWWNLKNRNISFEECRRYFTKVAGKEIKVH